MKSILSILFLMAFAISLSSCLKDKDFENQKYGIDIVDIPGVSFPQSASSPVTKAITAASTPVVLNGPVITLEQSQAATNDVKVTIKDNPALITSYNTGKAASDQLHAIPAGSYSFNTLTPTIKSGAKFTDELKITINNSLNLDPDKTYAIGVSIASADQGHIVAENMKDLIIAIPIKNKYDGIYTATGYFYHPSAPRKLASEKDAVTSGSNGIIVELGDLGGANYFMKLVVDPLTNNVTVTAAPGAAGSPYTMYSNGLPSPYTAAWTESAQCTNRYDPATKTFYIRVGYGGGTRVSEEKLVYKGPRP